MKILCCIIVISLLLEQIISANGQQISSHTPFELKTNQQRQISLRMTATTAATTTSKTTTSTTKKSNKVCSVGAPLIFFTILGLYCRKKRQERIKKIKKETEENVKKLCDNIKQNQQQIAMAQYQPPYQNFGQPMYNQQNPQQYQWPNVPPQISFPQQQYYQQAPQV